MSRGPSKYRVWIEDKEGNVLVETFIPITDLKIKDFCPDDPAYAANAILSDEAYMLLERSFVTKWDCGKWGRKNVRKLK